MRLTRSKIADAAGRETPFLSITEVLIPTLRSIDVEAHLAMLNGAAEYVHRQASILPTPYRVGFRAALIWLDIEAVLSEGRRYQNLPFSKRQSRLRDWETSRFSVKRDVVRLLRGLAVFAYYDHPTFWQSK
jgi:hypothetical protein